MNRALASLVGSFVEAHPEEAAHRLETLDLGEAADVLRDLPGEALAPVVDRLTPPAAGRLLAALGPGPAAEVLTRVAPHQAALVLRHMEPDDRDGALGQLPPDEARGLLALGEYPPETAGSMMDPRVASLPIDLNAHEAIEVLRRTPRESLYYLYVTDRERRLLGVLTMRHLLLAAPQDPIASFVRREVVSVPATMDREEVAALMQQGHLLALPVVDAEGRLLGVVSHDQVLSTIQEEAFEDMQRMVGAGGDESVFSPLGTALRRRLPWLCVNLVTAFAATVVISFFEHLFSRITALAVLLPIVSALGGNGGAQTLAVVMRGLALRQILPGAMRRLILKEALAGAANGALVASLAGAVVYFWSGQPALGVVIALAMVVNMITAGLAGAAIPLLLRALGRDPAQSSQIFLTTVTDIVGFASFLGFAALFLPYLQ